jgi:DNA-binding transcriptional regulator YhcF (GntR family)
MDVEPTRALRSSPDGSRPVITIDTGSPVPPYEQLRAQLAGQINDRTLAVGTRLPTVRRLAADLGLAVNTVARSYRELEEAGLVETRGRAGTFVAAAGEHSRQRAQSAAQEYAAVATRLGLDLDEALRIVHAALLTRQPGAGPTRP